MDNKSVGYLAVQNLHYPRNRRIRNNLYERGWSIVTLELSSQPGEPRLRKWRRYGRDTLHRGRGHDVYVLSEFSLKFAPIAWLWCRLNSAVFVVDAFVGIYETNIEDWKKYSPKSLRARLFGFQDYLAYRLADYLLIDNAFRASQLVQSHPAVSPSTIIDLPVGAPQWCASVAPTPVSGEIMQVLFYGNFLPLHGASTLIEALKLLPSDVKVSLTLIGGGDRRSDVMARAGELGVAKSCAFVSPVPETELACYIGRSHVVAGVFGSSAKARSVIPNKVWQGLASGRTVVTRQSPALTELDNFTGSQLVSVAPEDPAALAQALTAVYRSGDYMRYFGETYASLERYVESRFDALRRLDVRDSSGR